MFDLHENLLCLDIPAHQVLHLHQSIGLVNLAIPGFPTQGVGASLVAFSEGSGVRVTVALHLKQSARLVFYMNEQGAVSPDQVEDVIEEGVFFIESMGFLLSDFEYQALSAKEREKLWNTLRLQQGVEPAAVVEQEPSPLRLSSQLEERRQRLIGTVGKILGSL